MSALRDRRRREAIKQAELAAMAEEIKAVSGGQVVGNAVQNCSTLASNSRPPPTPRQTTPCNARPC